jgi:hypothetical protein
MTAKKSIRYLAIEPTVAFKLNLDPDIYSSSIAAIIGVGNTLLASQKTITTTLKGAVKDGHAKLLKCTVAKGVVTSDETRGIELLCDIDSVDTAPTLLIGKVVKLGYGNVVADWIITKVR